ncbi:MAG: glycosyl hydrolase family 65 protein [Pseudomonadota bacterium]
MNNKAYQEIMSAKSWLVAEKKWDRKQQQVRETQFTLGNGYLCCRGILEEVPYDSTPGTFIGGLYDKTGAQITELVNLPNPLVFRFDAYGEKLDPIATDIILYKRILDLKQAELFRHTIYKTTHKKRIDYRSRRFISLHNKNLLVMEIEITPLDAAMTLNAQTMIDAGISNRGTVTEGRKRHYQLIEVKCEKGCSYICVETFENKVHVAYASALEICRKNRCHLVADRALNIRVRKDETIVLRKFVAIQSSAEVKPGKLRVSTIGILKKAIKRGFHRLNEDHVKEWAKRWNIADVDIEGDAEATRALRFNVYHLLIAGNEDNDDVSIGARTLSGEGYRGHIFWDTELFILPFFIYTNPKVAKNLLLYRYHRINAARNNALAKGFRGALFPWESAGTGEECTPSWAKNFDGSIIKIVTLDEEHHIVADVAYAFAHYCNATGDDVFRNKYALEVMFATARFWMSRTVYNKKRKKYELHHVMGPDEFHEDVNNNAYTNMMAQWNLKAAAEWYKKAKKDNPRELSKVIKRIRISSNEVRQWLKAAQKMYIPYSKKRGLIEPFEGFFKLKEHRITQLDSHLMPCLPAAVKWQDIGKTQLIKQADVVMLLYLFSNHFTLKEKNKNYYFNERRTLHKSSLSPAIHSIVGLEVGDEDKALHYFAHALSTDLSDIHGNTHEGFHAASGGGTWQAAVMGFAGLRRKGKVLSLNPHLPLHWKGMKFCVYWHGVLLRVSLAHHKTDIEIGRVPANKKIFVEVYEQTQQIKSYSVLRFINKSCVMK